MLGNSLDVLNRCLRSGEETVGSGEETVSGVLRKQLGIGEDTFGAC